MKLGFQNMLEASTTILNADESRELILEIMEHYHNDLYKKIIMIEKHLLESYTNLYTYSNRVNARNINLNVNIPLLLKMNYLNEIARSYPEENPDDLDLIASVLVQKYEHLNPDVSTTKKEYINEIA